MPVPRTLIALLLVTCATPLTAPPAQTAPLLAAPGCALFPANNVWNTAVTQLPVHPRSAQWIASMGGAGRLLHPDFGSSGDPANPYGIPYTVVGSSHPSVTVAFAYASESDPGPYPVGPDTPIEGGASSTGDRHALIVNRDTCRLYEVYDTHYSPAGSTAGSGAIFDLGSNALRPDSWTSADAAGLPILPGLLRPDEVSGGQVNHAIRVTAARTDRSHLWPARHDAGAASDPSLPPMGARFRLRAGTDISGFSPQTQVVLRAFQTYGMIVADNGSNWFFSGSADNAWDPTMISQLKAIPAGDFEAVDESALMVDPNSAATNACPAAGGTGSGAGSRHLRPLPAVRAWPGTGPSGPPCPATAGSPSASSGAGLSSSLAVGIHAGGAALGLGPAIRESVLGRPGDGWRWRGTGPHPSS